MFFSELYGAYYNAMAKILKKAANRSLSSDELREIIEDNAFGESILNIAPAITEERWQLLRHDGSSILRNEPSMPLTTLQKMWLKAISLDPRMRLFGVDFGDLDDVEPLFTPDDYCVFDKYSDGDPYDDPNYQKYFKIILDAIKNEQPLYIHMTNRKGGVSPTVGMPKYLEYSEKDDKFRLICTSHRNIKTINLARIVDCRPYKKPYDLKGASTLRKRNNEVEFELINERNALERAMLHFAHFEKEAERIDQDRYRVKITYDKDDETEIVIRILSFGPMIRVTAPQNFKNLIKQRLINQKVANFS